MWTSIPCDINTVSAVLYKFQAHAAFLRVTSRLVLVFTGDTVSSFENCILNLYKGKGEALGYGNYQGLKLADQVTKLLEPVLDSFIHEMLNIDEMQFIFVPSKGTTDAISIVRQLHEKYIAAKKTTLLCLRRPCESLRSCPKEGPMVALMSLGVEEWAVPVIQGKYSNARSHVWVNGQYSEDFAVGVVCRGSSL